MTLTLQELGHASEHLRRPEESSAYHLLERRHEIFMDLPQRFEGLAIGWHRAAVRLFGEHAEAALDALVANLGARAEWPEREEAETKLLRAAECVKTEIER